MENEAREFEFPAHYPWEALALERVLGQGAAAELIPLPSLPAEETVLGWEPALGQGREPECQKDLASVPQ